MLLRSLIFLCILNLVASYVGRYSPFRYTRSILVVGAAGEGGKASVSGKDEKGAGFSYDPSNYKDSNSGNYRRLTDQLAAAKSEEEQLEKEAADIKRKEEMEAMMLRKENDTFWNTPDDKIVATSEKFSISPTVLKVITDLDEQLVGLKPVKEKMRRYAGQMLLHKIRDANGLKTEVPPLHHVFTGNPGTGKTTVAMTMGRLYAEMGFIGAGHTVQATRADLVGQYIGHTGPKTREMITRSFGGVLFIDEAYGLHKADDTRDYGSEVIEMLVKFIDTTENKDFVLVLAGYRDKMTAMLNANLNLMSRIGNWIDFPDYDNSELLEISQMLATQYGYSFDAPAQDKFKEFMNLRKEFPYFSNARTVRNCMERARRISATRVLASAFDSGADFTMDEIQKLEEQDFDMMVREIKDLPRTTMLP